MAGGNVARIADHTAARRQALAGPPGFKGIVHNGKVFLIALFASLGGLLYGYNQGVFSGVLVMHNFHDHFASTLDHSGLRGMVTAILELGAWLGCLVYSYIADRLGRRGGISFACFFFVIGVAVQTAAQNPAYLYTGRFIVGFGVGCLSIGVPLLNAELAPPEVRGAFVTLQQLSIEFGIMVSFWIDYGTNYIGGTGEGQKETAWRLPLALQLAPALILWGGIYLLPESPRYLLQSGREEDSLRVLASLRRLPIDHELVRIEHLEVKSEYLFEQETNREKFPQYQDGSRKSRFLLQVYSYASLITNRSNFRRVATGAIIMFFQQWSGINAVLYYAPTIFGSLELSGNTTNLLATGVVGIVMLIATIPTVLYLDTLGRRPILALGAVGMALCHTILAFIIGFCEDDWASHSAAGWTAVVFVWLYAVCFGWSWGPVAWVYISEVFPLSIRAKGLSIAASSNWMNNFIIGEITPTMLKHMRFGTYILFGALTWIAAIYVWWFVPETRQSSLEEMDIVFGDTSRSSAQDQARLARINDEIGLTKLIEVGYDKSKESAELEPNDEKHLEEKV
ncbi:general substrate transporter [Atractiella rhizophila]|nr:general substrate transporter [Atractiella rhizophila]